MRQVLSIILLSLFTPFAHADFMSDLWRESSGSTFHADLNKPTRAARGREAGGPDSVDITIPRNSRNSLKVKIHDANGNREFPNLKRIDTAEDQDSWIYEATDGEIKLRVTLNSDRAIEVELKKGSQTLVGSRWMNPCDL